MNYDNVAIMFDGRFVSKVGTVFKYVFENEFEAMNFCYTIEQEEGVVEGSSCLYDIRNDISVIQRRNLSLIDV